MPMQVLALDLGSKTIGTALCLGAGDEVGWPVPHEVLPRRGDRQDVGAVVALIRAKAIEVVVIGLPLELDGRQGPRARRTLSFAQTLRQTLHHEKLEVRVEMWDERFSTAQAERSLIAGDFSRSQRKERIDAVAAHFILESWLGAQQNLAQRQS